MYVLYVNLHEDGDIKRQIKTIIIMYCLLLHIPSGYCVPCIYVYMEGLVY